MINMDGSVIPLKDLAKDVVKLQGSETIHNPTSVY